MAIRQLVLAVSFCVAATGSFHAAPAFAARAVVGVSVRLPLQAPPARRAERVEVRPGHVWIPGYWRWNHGAYVWAGGYWTRARVGYRYAPARWVACGRHWCLHRGRWLR